MDAVIVGKDMCVIKREQCKGITGEVRTDYKKAFEMMRRSKGATIIILPDARVMLNDIEEIRNRHRVILYPSRVEGQKYDYNTSTNDRYMMVEEKGKASNIKKGTNKYIEEICINVYNDYEVLSKNTDIIIDIVLQEKENVHSSFIALNTRYKGKMKNIVCIRYLKKEYKEKYKIITYDYASADEAKSILMKHIESDEILALCNGNRIQTYRLKQ